jgi:hypothetical protein
MKKSWNDPAKRPAKDSTMNTEGDFGKFTDLMRKVVKVHPTKPGGKPKPISSSRAPAV